MTAAARWSFVFGSLLLLISIFPICQSVELNCTRLTVNSNETQIFYVDLNLTSLQEANADSLEKELQCALPEEKLEIKSAYISTIEYGIEPMGANRSILAMDTNLQKIKSDAVGRQLLLELLTMVSNQPYYPHSYNLRVIFVVDGNASLAGEEMQSYFDSLNDKSEKDSGLMINGIHVDAQLIQQVQKNQSFVTANLPVLTNAVRIVDWTNSSYYDKYANLKVLIRNLTEFLMVASRQAEESPIAIVYVKIGEQSKFTWWLVGIFLAAIGFVLLILAIILLSLCCKRKAKKQVVDHYRTYELVPVTTENEHQYRSFNGSSLQQPDTHTSGNPDQSNRLNGNQMVTFNQSKHAPLIDNDSSTSPTYIVVEDLYDETSPRPPLSPIVPEPPLTEHSIVPDENHRTTKIPIGLPVSQLIKLISFYQAQASSKQDSRNAPQNSSPIGSPSKQDNSTVPIDHPVSQNFQFNNSSNAVPYSDHKSPNQDHPHFVQHSSSIASEPLRDHSNVTDQADKVANRPPPLHDNNTVPYSTHASSKQDFPNAPQNSLPIGSPSKQDNSTVPIDQPIAVRLDHQPEPTGKTDPNSPRPIVFISDGCMMCYPQPVNTNPSSSPVTE